MNKDKSKQTIGNLQNAYDSLTLSLLELKVDEKTIHIKQKKQDRLFAKNNLASFLLMQ